MSKYSQVESRERKWSADSKKTKFISYNINFVTTLSLWYWRLHEFCLQMTQFSDLKPYLSDFCLSAVAATKLQCWWEYGFSDIDVDNLRATAVSIFLNNDLKDQTTNSFISERDFSRLDRLSKVYNSRNRKFKYDNNMTKVIWQ